MALYWGQRLPKGVLDLDTHDLDNPLMSPEYAREIFKSYYEAESQALPNPSYIENQPNLTWDSRNTAVNRIRNSFGSFFLKLDTLFLAVNMLDRYLSAKAVSPDSLELLGITMLWLACKYSEVKVVSAEDLANGVEGKDDPLHYVEMLEAERDILMTLQFKISYPGPLTFLRRVSKVYNYDGRCRILCQYLMELCLWDHRFLPYRPSQVVASAVYLTRTIFGWERWNETLAYYAGGYKEEDVKPVSQLMAEALVSQLSTLPSAQKDLEFSTFSEHNYSVAEAVKSWVKANGHHFFYLHVKSFGPSCGQKGVEHGEMKEEKQLAVYSSSVGGGSLADPITHKGST